MKKTFNLFAIVLFILPLCGTSSAQKIGNSYGAYFGYWKPSLQEANDLLDLWADELRDADINPEGDDEFTGNLSFGAMITRGVGKRTALRAEMFYWKKSLQQTARDKETYDYGNGYIYTAILDGDASASIRIIPVVASGLYYFGDLNGNVRPYFGGGLGLSFWNAEVEAEGRSEITSDFGYSDSDRESFKADDSGSSIILQLLGGLEYVFSEKISFFAEGRYISGNITVEENRNRFEEDISISGLLLKGGIVYYLQPKTGLKKR